jgi:hypothetical protein
MANRWALAYFSLPLSCFLYRLPFFSSYGMLEQSPLKGAIRVTVSFQLRPHDLAAAARFIANHNASIKAQLVRAQIVCALLAGAALLVLAWFSTGGSLRLVDVVFALGAALVAYVFAVYYLKRNYIQRVVALASDKNPKFQRNMQYTIEADGLAAVSDLGTSTIHWSAIQHLDEDASYIYLSLPGVNTILIPKSAFPDSAQQDAFAKTLRSYLTS